MKMRLRILMNITYLLLLAMTVHLPLRSMHSGGPSLEQKLNDLTGKLTTLKGKLSGLKAILGTLKNSLSSKSGKGGPPPPPTGDGFLNPTISSTTSSSISSSTSTSTAPKKTLLEEIKGGVTLHHVDAGQTIDAFMSQIQSYADLENIKIAELRAIKLPKLTDKQKTELSFIQQQNALGRSDQDKRKLARYTGFVHLIAERQAKIKIQIIKNLKNLADNDIFSKIVFQDFTDLMIEDAETLKGKDLSDIVIACGNQKLLTRLVRAIAQDEENADTAMIVQNLRNAIIAHWTKKMLDALGSKSTHRQIATIQEIADILRICDDNENCPIQADTFDNIFDTIKSILSSNKDLCFALFSSIGQSIPTSNQIRFQHLITFIHDTYRMHADIQHQQLQEEFLQQQEDQQKINAAESNVLEQQTVLNEKTAASNNAKQDPGEAEFIFRNRQRLLRAELASAQTNLNLATKTFDDLIKAHNEKRGKESADIKAKEAADAEAERLAEDAKIAEETEAEQLASDTVAAIERLIGELKTPPSNSNALVAIDPNFDFDQDWDDDDYAD